MFSCHRTFRHRQLSLSHALGTKTLSAIRAAAFLDLQLLSTPAKLRYSAFARMFRIVTGTRAPVLQAVRVRLRSDARARTSAGQRTGTRLLSTDAAVAEAVGGTTPGDGGTQSKSPGLIRGHELALKRRLRSNLRITLTQLDSKEIDLVERTEGEGLEP
jgi:hypothetical protein